MSYELIKSLHIIFMVTWFAGLFYLPRLFVYHASAEDTISIERFRIMERKLLWGITTPGGVLTVVFGIWLVSFFPHTALAGMAWLKWKMVLVLVLIAYHVWCALLWRRFKQDRNTHSHAWYRWFNEAPVVLLVAIVLLVVMKPF